jgi:hypothetical protein
MTELELFMSKVDTTNDCWAWTGVIDGKGYGKFTIKRKQLIASRYAYKAFVGDIPNGLFVLHKCDVRNCVNPEHLFLGTAKDNIHDMVSKKRQANQKKTHCPAGHEYSEDNTYRYSYKKRNLRLCKQCLLNRRKASQERESNG